MLGIETIRPINNDNARLKATCKPEQSQCNSDPEAAPSVSGASTFHVPNGDDPQGIFIIRLRTTVLGANKRK
jgi:hypothetical protein